MTNRPVYPGRCFCGAVELTVTGEPILMGYCHCDSCREWSAGPVNAFTLWKPDAVRITKGAEHIGSFNRTDRSFRQWCKICGGHLLADHPTFGITDVYAAVIPSFPFRPALHVHYQEAVLTKQDCVDAPTDDWAFLSSAARRNRTEGLGGSGPIPAKRTAASGCADFPLPVLHGRASCERGKRNQPHAAKVWREIASGARASSGHQGTHALSVVAKPTILQTAPVSLPRSPQPQAQRHAQAGDRDHRRGGRAGREIQRATRRNAQSSHQSRRPVRRHGPVRSPDAGIAISQGVDADPVCAQLCNPR
jgi:hypothetical protein